MKLIIRTIITFVAFCAIQYVIPYYLLAIGGIVAGVFLYKTSDDRPLAIGILLGSIVFAVFAYAMAQVFPVVG